MSDSAHPCHNLSNPAAQIFMCRHCMAKFYDPIQRWRHSKICKKALAKSNPEIVNNPVKKGPSLPSRKPEETKEEEPTVQVQTPPKKRKGNGESSNLSCVICKKIFINMEEMREHVRNPCNKPERVLPSRGDVTMETNPQLILFENQLRQLEEAAKGGEENTCSQIESLLMAAQALQQHQQERIITQQQKPSETPPPEDSESILSSQKSSGQSPISNHKPVSSSPDDLFTETIVPDNQPQQEKDTEPSMTSSISSQESAGNPSVIQVNATTIRLRLPEANTLKESSVKDTQSVEEQTVPNSTEENLSHEPKVLESSFTCELLQNGNCAATGIKITKKKASPVPVSSSETSVKKDVCHNNKEFTKLSTKAIQKEVSKVTVDLSKNNQCHMKGCRHNGMISNFGSEFIVKKAKHQEVKVIENEPVIDKTDECVNKIDEKTTEGMTESISAAAPDDKIGSNEKKEEAGKCNSKTITRREPSTRIRKRKVPFQELENNFSSYRKVIKEVKKPAVSVQAKKSSTDTKKDVNKEKNISSKDVKKPVRDCKKVASGTAKPNKESSKTSRNNRKAANVTKVNKDDKKTKSKAKPLRTPKCRICDKVFKTLDLLKKHNKVPCKVRLTRNLTQKVLRPKRTENNQKEAVKQVVKKTAKPVSEPKMKMFDRKFTDARIENSSVKKNKKPIRRQKPEYNFCITRSQSLKRVQWAIDLEGLTEKEKYFYGLGLVSIEQIPIKCASTVIKQTQSVSVVENKQKEVNELPPVLEKVVEVRRHIQDDIYILNDPIRKSCEPPPLISVSESSSAKNRLDPKVSDNSNKENLCSPPCIDSAKSPLKTLEERHFLDAIEINSGKNEPIIESVQAGVMDTCIKTKDKEDDDEGNKSPSITVGLQTDITTDKILYPRPDFYRRFLKKMEKQRIKDEEEAREKQIQGNCESFKANDTHELKVDNTKTPCNIFDKFDQPRMPYKTSRTENKEPEVTIVYPDKPIVSEQENKEYVPKLPYDPKMYEIVDDETVTRVPAEENVKVKDQHGKELVDLIAQTLGIFPSSKEDPGSGTSGSIDPDDLNKTPTSQEDNLNIIVLNNPSSIPSAMIECPFGKDVVHVPDIVERQIKTSSCSNDDNGEVYPTSSECGGMLDKTDSSNVTANLKLKCNRGSEPTVSVKATEQMENDRFSRSLLPSEIVDVHLNLQPEQILNRSKGSTSSHSSDISNNTQEQMINENKGNLCTPCTPISKNQPSITTSINETFTTVSSSCSKNSACTQSLQTQNSQNSKSSFSHSSSISQCHKPLKKRIDSYMLSLQQNEDKAKVEMSKSNAHDVQITQQACDKTVASSNQQISNQEVKVEEKQNPGHQAIIKDIIKDNKADQASPVDIKLPAPALSPLPQEQFEPICNTILTFDSDLLSSDILEINPFLDDSNNGNSNSILDTSVIVSPKPSDSSMIVSPKPSDSFSSELQTVNNVCPQSLPFAEKKLGLSTDSFFSTNTFDKQTSVSSPKSLTFYGSTARSVFSQKTGLSQSTGSAQTTKPQHRPGLPFTADLSQTTGPAQETKPQYRPGLPFTADYSQTTGSAQETKPQHRPGLPFTADLSQTTGPGQTTSPSQRSGLPYTENSIQMTELNRTADFNQIKNPQQNPAHSFTANLSQTTGSAQSTNPPQRTSLSYTTHVCQGADPAQTTSPGQTTGPGQTTCLSQAATNSVYSDISDDSDEEEITTRQNTAWKALPINSLPTVDFDVLRQADRLSRSQLSSSQLQSTTLLPNRTVPVTSNRSSCPSSAINSNFDSAKLDWTENDEMYVMSLLRYRDHITHQPVPYQMYNIHSHHVGENLNFQSNPQNIIHNPTVTISYTNAQSITTRTSTSTKHYTENRLLSCNTTNRFSSIGNAPEVPRVGVQPREVWNTSTSFESVYSDISDDSNDNSNVPTTIESVFWQKQQMNTPVNILAKQNPTNMVSSAFSDISDDSSDSTITRRNAVKKAHIPQSKLCLVSSSSHRSNSNFSSVTAKPNCYQGVSAVVSSSCQTPNEIPLPSGNSFSAVNSFPSLEPTFSANNLTPVVGTSSNVKKSDVENDDATDRLESIIETTDFNPMSCTFSDDSSEGFDKSFVEHSIYESDDNEKINLSPSLTSSTQEKGQPTNHTEKSAARDSPLIEVFDQSSNDIKFAETLFDQVIKKDKVKQGNKGEDNGFLGKSSIHSDFSGENRTLKTPNFTNDRAFASVCQTPVSDVLNCDISDSADVAYVVIDKGVEICRTMADSDNRDDSDTGDDFTQGSDLDWS